VLKQAWSAANVPRRWLHKMLGLGRRHPPREVAFGLLLGWIIGFGPWGLHTAVPVLLLVLMRTFWPMAIAGGVAGLTIWPMAAGYTEELGHALLSADGMVAGGVRWAAEAPLLAWMGLTEYRLIGAMAIGLVIGGVASIALRVVLAILMKFGIGKIGPWVFSRVAKATGAGPDEDESVRETLWTKGPFRFIRPAGLIGVPVLCLLFGWIGSSSAGSVVQHQVTSQLSAQLGTKVTLEGCAVSFSAGTLGLTGLTVWDPERDTTPLFAVQSARLDVDGGALLRRRVVATEAVLQGVTLRIAKRASGGGLNLDLLKPFGGGTGGTGGAGSPSNPGKSLLDWAKGKAADAANHESVDWAELVDRLRPYLEERPRPALTDDEAHAAEFPPPGEGAAWNLRRRAPGWVVERAALEQCRLEYTARAKPLVVEPLSLELRHWSSDRDLYGKPITFSLQGELSGVPVRLQGTRKPPADGGGLSLSLK